VPPDQPLDAWRESAAVLRHFDPAPATYLPFIEAAARAGHERLARELLETFETDCGEFDVSGNAELPEPGDTVLFIQDFYPSLCLDELNAAAVAGACGRAVAVFQARNHDDRSSVDLGPLLLHCGEGPAQRRVLDNARAVLMNAQLCGMIEPDPRLPEVWLPERDSPGVTIACPHVSHELLVGLVEVGEIDWALALAAARRPGADVSLLVTAVRRAEARGDRYEADTLRILIDARLRELDGPPLGVAARTVDLVVERKRAHARSLSEASPPPEGPSRRSCIDELHRQTAEIATTPFRRWAAEPGPARELTSCFRSEPEAEACTIEDLIRLAEAMTLAEWPAATIGETLRELAPACFRQDAASEPWLDELRWLAEISALNRPLPGIEGILRAAVQGELRGVEIDASTLPQMLATLRAWGRVGEIEQLGASIEVDVGPIVDWRVQPGSTKGSCPAMIAAHSLALAGDLRGALQPIAACWDAPGAQVGETLAVVAAELERRPDPHVYAALRELVDSSQRSSER
jgi:hypothetical protein